MKSVKPVMGLSGAFGLLLFALPRLEMGQGLTLPSLFGAVWLGMILLVIGAHLHEMLGVDEETRQEMDRIREYRRWRRGQRLESAAGRAGANESR